MGYIKTEQSGHTTYGLCSFTLDSEADLDTLPINVMMGSTAIVIDTGKVYMLKSNGVWKEI